MRLSDAELRKLPVVTVAGERLGRVAGLVVDTMTHGVVQYLVDRSRLPVGLLPPKLTIHSSQVVSLDDEKMVVKDVLIAELEKEAAANISEQVASAVSNMARTAQTTNGKK
jgi:sporulation protein YlmC with PRC-barrel domain